MQHQDDRKPHPYGKPDQSRQHDIGKVCANPPGLDDRGKVNSEFVDVTVGGGGHLGGVRLQHLVDPHTSREHFADVVQFPVGLHLAPGTTVRVHMGGGKNGVGSNGIYHWYAGGEHGRGNYRLNNGGDIVRLLDSPGHELARRVLTGRECEDVPSGPKVVVPPPVVPVRSYGQDVA